MPPIPLPHMHNGFSCHGDGSFMIAVMMIIGVGRRFRQAGRLCGSSERKCFSSDQITKVIIT